MQDYFIEHAPLTGQIECDASSILTDAHVYQLSHIDWPSLGKIRIRACPNLTPFALDYMQQIIDKHKDQPIKVVRYSSFDEMIEDTLSFRISNWFFMHTILYKQKMISSKKISLKSNPFSAK